MILPIVAYGDPVLKRKAQEIDEDYPELQQLIDDMFETMENAQGVGLAAPQIGRSIRLFVIDASSFYDENEPETEELKNFQHVFINPIIEEEEGEEWKFSEGCLSIPTIREDVFRKPKLKISYYDRDFNFHEKALDGYAARIVQHEYDHVEGVLFTDRINPLRKGLLKSRLVNISKGNVQVSYRMRFPARKR